MITMAEWPHVYLSNELTAARLREALTYSDSLPSDTPGRLRDRLDYLESYGAGDTEEDRTFRVVLSQDWAPHSFNILWLQARTDAVVFNGGLICHCSGVDPLTVSLSAQAWGIHT